MGGREEKWLYYEVASLMRNVGTHDVCENFIELLKSYGTLFIVRWCDQLDWFTVEDGKTGKHDIFLKYILYHLRFERDTWENDGSFEYSWEMTLKIKMWHLTWEERYAINTEVCFTFKT